MPAPHTNATALRVPGSRALALFRLYLHWYLRRHFHALRVAHPERLPDQLANTIVFVNHAGWWDPITMLLVSGALLPEQEHYAPMDAAALDHYAIFRHLGFFPVENETPRGAVQLLRAGAAIFARPRGVLWITPESRFADVRTRPLRFRKGLGALAARHPGVLCVPMAIEYIFWNERLPEILVNIGEPVTAEDAACSSAEWTMRLTEAQTRTMDELATLAEARDGAAFRTLVSGGGGIGGVYELWKRLSCALTGRAYRHEHGSVRAR